MKRRKESQENEKSGWEGDDHGNTTVEMSQPLATIRHSGKSASSTQGNRMFALDLNGEGAEEFAFSANITKKGDRG